MDPCGLTWPFDCNNYWSKGDNMFNFLKRIFYFRMGQKASRGFARTMGLKKLSGIAGLFGGYRAARRR